jgi:hypothetical protein
MDLIVAGTVARPTETPAKAAFRRVGHRANPEGFNEATPPGSGSKLLRIVKRVSVEDYNRYRRLFPGKNLTEKWKNHNG